MIDTTGPLLAIRDLWIRYGAVRAVRGVNLDVHPGEIVALMGANGAGKSSILNAVMGLKPPASGSVILGGEDVARRSPEYIVRHGMTLCPEGRRVFDGLTVDENLAMGAASLNQRETANSTRDQMLELFPVLATRLHQRAGTLSGGEQQLLSIARALMSRPQLLLLDEPSLGLAPLVVDRIFELIAQLQVRGVTILLVEQNVDLALRVASRAYLLSTGRVVVEGDAESMLNPKAVRRVYLGTH